MYCRGISISNVTSDKSRLTDFSHNGLITDYCCVIGSAGWIESRFRTWRNGGYRGA